MKSHRQCRLVDRDRGQGFRVALVRHGLTDVDLVTSRHGNDLPRRGLRNLALLKPFVDVDFGHLKRDSLVIPFDQKDIVPGVDDPVLNPSCSPFSQEVVEADGAHQKLKRGVGVAFRLFDMLDDGFEEGGKVVILLLKLILGEPLLGGGVDDGKIELPIVGVQFDEEIEDLVENLRWARAGPVDLVDDDDGVKAQLQGLLQNVLRLGHGPLEGIHEEENRINHLENPLNLAAEICVAGGIDNVDLVVLVCEGRILGEDGDPLLPLQVVGVHDPFGDLLVVPEDTGLSQYCVDKRCLAVVNMGDNGDILDHLHARLSLTHLLFLGLPLHFPSREGEFSLLVPLSEPLFSERSLSLYPL